MWNSSGEAPPLPSPPAAVAAAAAAVAAAAAAAPEVGEEVAEEADDEEVDAGWKPSEATTQSSSALCPRATTTSRGSTENVSVAFEPVTPAIQSNPKKRNKKKSIYIYVYIKIKKSKPRNSSNQININKFNQINPFG